MPRWVGLRPDDFNIGQWIESSCKKYISSRKFDDLIFVAMNKAAETKSFKYSANYLSTYFSEIFTGSKAFAYTTNTYDKETIRLNREKTDILLCSVGSRSTQLSYIDEWLHKAKKQAINSSEFIGDFCLSPIDASGHLLYQPADLLKDIEENLDPYPCFELLKDIKASNTKIILPVYVSQEKKKKNENCPTGKEFVTATLLRSQILTDCILSTELAKNIEQSIGKYLVKRTSRPSKMDYACVAFFLSTTTKNTLLPRMIRITDWRHRSCLMIRCLLPLGNRMKFPKSLLVNLRTKTLISIWKKLTGRFEFKLDEQEFVFDMPKPTVRRPGQWSLITAGWLPSLLTILSTKRKTKK